MDPIPRLRAFVSQRDIRGPSICCLASTAFFCFPVPYFQLSQNLHSFVAIFLNNYKDEQLNAIIKSPH